MTNESIPESAKLHRDKVLNQDINFWEDPVCCCEPEPRWLAFQQEMQARPGDWENVARAPCDEL